MSFDVVATPRFKRDIKKLAKKYPSLKSEYSSLINGLAENPVQGIPLGNNCFKIRVAIASKGKGRSGGARVVTYITYQEDIVFLLTIFDKAEKENLTDRELKELLGQLDE